MQDASPRYRIQGLVSAAFHGFVMENTALYLEPGNIGSLTLRNRLVRASTSETMATADGAGTPDLARLYGKLAAGGAGLLLTGHIYVEKRGQASANQPGLYDDRLVESMVQVTGAVHAENGRIFAEIGHAGSQTMMPEVGPIAPSATANEMYGLQPREATPDEIEAVITAFGSAARRAKEAGFDGVHIHGGNGYLISEFSSPITNRRSDEWGGDAERRGRFMLEVYDAVRSAVGEGFPVTARIGIGDSIAGGIDTSESIERVRVLAGRGLDAVEVSYGIMKSYLENIRKYVAVDFSQAAKNALVQRLVKPKGAEAYYRHFASAVKEAVDIPVILVGGVRTTETMTDVLESGDADFIAMARPFIREPDLANKLAAGRTGTVECVSCNMCLVHDGFDPLRCWRTSPVAVAAHVYAHYISNPIATRAKR